MSSLAECLKLWSNLLQFNTTSELICSLLISKTMSKRPLLLHLYIRSSQPNVITGRLKAIMLSSSCYASGPLKTSAVIQGVVVLASPDAICALRAPVSGPKRCQCAYLHPSCDTAQQLHGMVLCMVRYIGVQLQFLTGVLMCSSLAATVRSRSGRRLHCSVRILMACARSGLKKST